MTPKKVLPQTSPQSTDETPVAEVTVRAKRRPPVVRKIAAEVPKALAPKTPKPAGKSLAKKSTKTAIPAAAKANNRSSARPATQNRTRKPAQPKTTALPSATDSAMDTALLAKDALLAEPANEMTKPPKGSNQSKAAAKVAPATATPPVINDAELWEQGSPIRLRIAQLRTRNALLEEQLQRLRPPLKVRGKKK